MTEFSVKITPSASLPATPQKNSLKSPKTIHNTMKETENLKRKLGESQLDVGSLIDPKIDLKH